MTYNVVANSNFRENRIKCGYSIRKISKAAGLTPAVICRLENGGAILPSTANRICSVFQCSFDDLFEIRKVDVS
jgi:DNA-binding XRE family transcriptional regulator